MTDGNMWGLTAKQSMRGCCERPGQARQAEVLHGGGYLTYVGFTVVKLCVLIGVGEGGVVATTAI